MRNTRLLEIQGQKIEFWTGFIWNLNAISLKLLLNVSECRTHANNWLNAAHQMNAHHMSERFFCPSHSSVGCLWFTLNCLADCIFERQVSEPAIMNLGIKKCKNKNERTGIGSCNSREDHTFYLVHILSCTVGFFHTRSLLKLLFWNFLKSQSDRI